MTHKLSNINQSFSEQAYIDFESEAVPHSWLLVADELYDQSLVLFKNKGNSKITKYGQGKVIEVWDAVDRSSFLLGGFALENMIKAFLVYENPNWISKGKLSKKLTTHSLTKLAERSMLLPWPKKGLVVLGAFENGLDSWARYPTALQVGHESERLILTSHLWIKYLELFQRYRKEIHKLLSKEWQGPHDFCGSYTFA